MAGEDGFSGSQSAWGRLSLAGKGIIAPGDPAEKPAVHKCAVNEEIEGFRGHEYTDFKDALAYNQRIAVLAAKSNWAGIWGALIFVISAVIRDMVWGQNTRGQANLTG